MIDSLLILIELIAFNYLLVKMRQALRKGDEDLGLFSFKQPAASPVVKPESRS